MNIATTSTRGPPRPVPKTTPLGELVLATFDHAARYSDDPRRIARLATTAVLQLLRHGRPAAASPPRQRPDQSDARAPGGSIDE